MSEVRHRAETSPKMVTEVGRLRGCNLEICVEDQFAKKKAVYGGIEQNTYSVELLLDKKDKINQAFYAKMKAAETDVKVKAFKKNFNLSHPTISDGDESDKDQHQGMYIIRAKAKAPVGKPLPIILQDRKGALTTADTFYSGCYARIQIQLKSYVHEGAKGVSVKLLGVQFAAQGDPLFASSVKGVQLEAIEEYDAESEDDLLGDIV